MTVAPLDLRLLTEAALDHAHAGRPHAAHELWEAPWAQAPAGEDKELLRGLIQRCAAAVNAAGGPRGEAAALRQADRAAPRLAPLAAYAEDLGLQTPVPDLAHDLHLAAPAWPRSTRDAPLQVDAVLVAGGHGRRAGGPKALKDMHGQPLWRWQVAQLRALGCARVFAAVHPAALDDGVSSLALGGGSVALAVDPDGEMLSSLQAALACRGATAEGATPGSPTGAERGLLLLPVDCPCPPRPVWAALVATARAREALGQPWQVVRPWVPTVSGPRRGHPVLLGPALLRAVAAADGRVGRLDRLIQALAPDERVDVPVDATEIRANYNGDGVSR